MLKKLRSNPYAASLVVFFLYAAWFLGQILYIHPDADQHGITGVDGAIGQWKNQVILVVSLTVIVSLLGWWKKIGFTTPLNRGGLKYLILPVGYILLMLSAVMFTSHNSSWLLAAVSPQQMIFLILVMLGIGFNEETMFRGILYYGFSSRFSILAAAVFSALIFGLLHYVNLILGAPLVKTDYQVLHAAAAGFMYIALRLRIGAIWPVMLFHALWDFCLFNMDTLKTAADSASTPSPLITIAIEILPATLYGSFVFWRWSVYQKKSNQDRQLRTAPET